MAIATADRVKETTTTTGTGTYTLAGAVVGFQTFVAGVGNGNTCHYAITDDTNWEVGIGTVTDAGSDTLSRDTILASSNAGAAVNWGAGTRTVFVTTAAAGAVALAAGHMYKLALAYSSATVVVVGPGNCRSSADEVNLALTAANTTCTITTANGAGGLNTPVLSQTATTHGTTTFEPSASIVSDLKGRAGTGTITTVGTAVTGLSMNDLALGDLIGNATNGWSQVTAWVPPTTPAGTDGTATLEAAIVGGNLTTAAFTIIENATIWPGATVGDKRRISTLSANGLSVVVSGAALTSNGAGVALQIGVEIASCFYAVHVGRISGTDGAFLSTQRTTPYAMTGLTFWRRVGWVRNTSAGDIAEFSFGPANREIHYEFAVTGNGSRVLSAGNATTWTAVDCSSLVPPTSRLIVMSLFLSTPTTGGETSLFARPRNTGASAASRNLKVACAQNGSNAATTMVTCDAAQFLDYALSQAGGSPGYFELIGYQDSV